MKPRHVALGLALAGAAALVAFGDSTPDGGVVEPLVHAPRAHARAPAAPALANDAVLRLTPRGELLAADDHGEGPFRSQNWNPPPPPPQAPPPPPPPSAPPLPFAYIGKAYQGGAWEVYLARGDATYTVKGGEVIDATYRIDAVAPPLLRITYLPLGQAQQINIGASE